MTNYKQFYNAWIGFAKPKRQLLVEQESSKFVIDKMSPADFLSLTTDEQVYKQIIANPSTQGAYDPTKAQTLSLTVDLGEDGIAKVISHEGRNRSATALRDGFAVPVEIKVVNKQAALKDVSGFAGQFSPITISTIEIVANGNKLKTAAGPGENDPLAVGEEKIFKGYMAPPSSRGSNDFLQNYLDHLYYGDRKMRSLGVRGYVDMLNQLYTAVDSEGKEYTFALTGHVYFDKITGERKPPTSMVFPNLQPHPVEVYGSEQEANKRTYTIKKK